MSGKPLAYLMMALAMLTVGSTVIASKLIGTSMPPFTAAVLRFAVALPILLLLMRVTGTRMNRPDRHDAALLLVQALAGSAGYTALLIYGTGRTSGTDAGIILGTLPAIAAIISFALLRDRISRSMVFAIALATAGVAITAMGPRGEGGSFQGNALVLAAVVCEGLFILLNRRLHVALAPLALAASMCGLGLVLSLPMAFGEIARGGLATQPIALAGAIYYGLVPTVCGFWLWYAGSARATPAEASLMTSLAPVSAVLLSMLVFGEKLGMLRLLGLGLVVAGILMASLRLPGRKSLTS